MAQVLIRHLAEETVARLKARAELAGKPLEQFLRELLAREAPLSPEERAAASGRLRAGQAPIDFDARSAIRSGRDDQDDPA